MTPTRYFIYIMIFKKYTYTGITNDIQRRIKEHLKGKCITTNRFLKHSKLLEIRYRVILGKTYEKVFKRYSKSRKLRISKDWKRVLV